MPGFDQSAQHSKIETATRKLDNPIWHRSQCFGVKWGARVLRVRSVSRGEVCASTGVQGAWVVARSDDY